MGDIHIDHVSLRYPGQLTEAVSGIDLKIEGGVINGLLGPNGAGKTTLIHLICGLLLPDSGRISTRDPGHSDLLTKSSIGFVPQQDGLFGELTLRENLRYYGRLYCLPAKLLDSRISYMTQYLQLSAHMDKKIRHFSGGMNRRANIVAALLHDPGFIILDEPTAGVDIQSRALIHDVIRDLQRQGKTILYTSHLLSEAQELCHRIFIMDHGKLLLAGRPEGLLERTGKTSLEELFLSLTGNTVRD